ncbi:hypothetical protein MGWOODY_XGa99 [hydrothermal vent metagenome]|uniref:Uncharacterized protein n=1 Tax=hydrothermal vent metagenome TaxID=652676 RepID=A0A160TQW5_9ZZZZ
MGYQRSAGKPFGAAELFEGSLSTIARVCGLSSQHPPLFTRTPP